MLPLLQRPPNEVTPPPPNFDAFVSFPGNDASSVNSHYPRDISFTYQRAFPIRTSQPHRRPSAVNSFYSSHPEYHLRRKTPNGTIDAGYDGSPTSLSHGPPPLKHLGLPRSATSTAFPGAALAALPLRGHNVNSDHHRFSSPSNIGVNDDARHTRMVSAPWPLAGDMSNFPGAFQENTQTLLLTGRHHRSSAYYDVSGMFPSIYQPLLRANEYNVRAFCPPPVVMNDSLPLGQIPLYATQPTWNHGNYVRPGGAPSRPAQQPDFGSKIHKLVPELLHHPSFDDSIEREATLNVPGLRQTNADTSQHDSIGITQLQSYSPGFRGQHGFREKVLSQAHKSYMDLLAHLQTARRSQSGKTNTGLGTATKLLVYPKPPRPSLKILESVESSTPTRFSERDHGRNYHLGNYTTIHPPGTFSHSLSGGRMSVFAMANSSLEMLNSLCEQSGWNWIEGILLGGCLHYGMEQYEEALEWFSRITTLDSSHVEAITNIAATLYCLNRQIEAEQHWIRAVKLQPSYLEAVEHLVGLLYKQRSREAVEIINYVQQALILSPPGSTRPVRLPASGPAFQRALPGTTMAHDFQIADLKQAQHHRVTSQPGDSKSLGFGSSGYAVPGKENGRILALIHAKGTMLYSLKEVHEASAAFEEAVMISVGRRATGIPDLVRRIQTVLSPTEPGPVPHGQVSHPLRPLLLPPERARHTAHLVFGGSGDLPGLRYVTEGATKRAAVQTTSNSLLSLAKIFQDGLSSGHVSPDGLRRPSGVGDILALYYLSLSLQESPSTANNVGILLAGVQQSTQCPQGAIIDLFPQPNIPGIIPGSGLALALAYYHYGLRLDPKHVHLHTNLGSLLKDLGQLDLAIQMYEQAVSCDGTFDIALTNLANAVKDRGRISDAIMYYKRAVSSNPDFAEAVCGLSTALNSVCDWRGRGGVMLQSGKYDRWHVDDRGLLIDARSLGFESGLTYRVVQIISKQLKEASQWGRGILEEKNIIAFAGQFRDLCQTNSFHPENALRAWAGKPWEGSRLIRLVERATRLTQWKWYRDRNASWSKPSSQYPRLRLPSNLTVPSAPTVLPFHTFTCPLSAKDIRVISQRNAIRISCSTLRLPWIPATVYPPPPPPSPQLNVGYVSSDFNNHPLAHLMQSVFGFHNPQRTRAVCYATTASDRSAHRQQIEREAPVFRDVSNWPSEKLVEQIIRDEIHILINLNGYTRGARNEIFAARPAPVQMSFMGFAGTLGAEWCDYILADRTAIPPGTLRPWRANLRVEDVFHDDTEGDADDWMYSENIIFCRDTFFCCDHAQSCDAGERQVTWVEEQQRRWQMRKQLFPTLADDAIILGNFNQLYKIEPTTFRSWLRILAQVPKAILWLLRFPELGEVNLRRTAKVWAGSEVASRIIFTDVAPKSQHIARARVCDLFLDTPECNAHTTAADVLWSSTPLLTLPRYPYKMCSRMAASILKGALPKSAEGRQVAAELIVGSETEYEQRAVRLASGLSYSIKDGRYGEGHGRLAEMRELLWNGKWNCGLFDTRRWVDDLETAYEEAWRRWVAGESGDICL
ncbi:glycosyl transferase family 41-domain-containing protein [Dactylonectria estremocensis]|uniref:protein O-GlcNAc transferase n=1 Tax=Dactylonectria estremocensis TaxID=1079267 RepID=A0A9P9J3X9_9HYPO|nr:glycosyl transferase family 41-domain-containing protein [Dactylonectria estremocensis]